MNDCTPEVKSDETVAAILNDSRTVAVVGASEKEDQPSNLVARYLKEHGYRVIPVNPNCREVAGEKCYPNLKAIPDRVDVVDIFRKAEEIPPIVDEAVEIGAGAVWMQLGLAEPESAEKARCAGLRVVMDRCMKEEHKRLSGSD